MLLKDNLNHVELYEWHDSRTISFTNTDRSGDMYPSHHINGPSWIKSHGYKQYCINGQCHNTKGPACIYEDRTAGYYLNGKKLTEKEWQIETGR